MYNWAPETRNSNGQMFRTYKDWEESKSQDKIKLCYFREYFFYPREKTAMERHAYIHVKSCWKEENNIPHWRQKKNLVGVTAI